MEIFQVTNGRLGFLSKRFTTILVICFIALPVLVMVVMMSTNSKFDISSILGIEVQNATALDVDSKPTTTSIPDDKLNDTQAHVFGRGSGSEYESSQLTSTPDSKLLNGSLAPRFGKASDPEYEYSQPTSTPDDKQLSKTLASSSSGGSVSENDTSQSTSIHNVNLLNGTFASRFGERPGSRNDSSESTSMVNDKLLDGLSPPGFDERSCLSKYRSVLYRKISSHKPSPFLLSKLRNYENLHKRCGPYTEPYNRTLKILKSGHVGSTTMCKYVVWRPDNGLGNRMGKFLACTSQAMKDISTEEIISTI